MNDRQKAVASDERGALTKRRVWVFGGGIAGLTVAHELVERGFEVHVVEPTRDPTVTGGAEDCQIGGLARTQWAQIDEADMARIARRAKGVEEDLPRADGYLLRFDFPISGGVIASAYQRQLDYVIKVLRTYDTIPPISIVGTCENEAEGKAAAEMVQKYICEGLEGISRFPDVHEKIRAEFNPIMGVQPPKITMSVAQYPVPGEHGFRYFPAFYEHVFDTMKRIPVLTTDQTFNDSFRTVYDNLIPTQANFLALERNATQPPRTVEVSREVPKALKPLLTSLQSALSTVGFTAEDLTRLSLKIFKYMTSCSERRQAEYEAMSWWDFIEGDRFSATGQRYMDTAPEILGAMVAKKSDARTQGNCVTQLLLDPLLRSDRLDSTLNGPTTVSWFEPWRTYLKKQMQPVKFQLGTLTDFRFDREQCAILPVAELSSGPLETLPGDLFVIAASLPAMLRAPDGGPGLAHRFMTVYEANRAEMKPEDAEVGDFDKLARWAAQIPDWNEPENMPDNPLQHLTGIQFFFAVNVLEKEGHTLYMDAPWRMSSISQATFWHTPRLGTRNYRGILSVDIGNVLVKGSQGTPKKSFWESTRDEIARDVWAQVKATFGENDRTPEPVIYHLDENITVDEKTDIPIRNETPYLVNRPGDWQRRPGDPGKYKVQSGRWALAGTYMRTYTRLTTMEAANESGRHAVNGILDSLEQHGSPETRWPRCKVHDPEQNELPDLVWLRNLDRELFSYGASDHEGTGAQFLPILSISWGSMSCRKLFSRGQRDPRWRHC